MRALFVTLCVALAALSGCAAPLEPEPDPNEETPTDSPESPSAEDFLDAAEELLPHGLHFVVTGPDQAFIVLGTSPLEEQATGPIELVSDDPERSEVHTFRAALAGDTDPDAELRARVLAGRFVLFGHKGELCRILPDDLGVLHRAGFEASYSWRDQGARTASEAWDLGESGALWVARVGALPSACTGAVWAAAERGPAPRVFTPSAGTDPSLSARALASFRELAEYAAIQREYREPTEEADAPAGHVGLWDSFEGGSPTTRLFREPKTGQRLVLVTATAGAGCGEFGASLWALFEPRAGGLMARAVGRDDPPPIDIVDAGDDGQLELFAGERASFVAEGERVQVDVSVPFTGCGC